MRAVLAEPRPRRHPSAVVISLIDLGESDADDVAHREQSVLQVSVTFLPCCATAVEAVTSSVPNEALTTTTTMLQLPPVGVVSAPFLADMAGSAMGGHGSYTRGAAQGHASDPASADTPGAAQKQACGAESAETAGAAQGQVSSPVQADTTVTGQAPAKASLRVLSAASAASDAGSASTGSLVLPAQSVGAKPQACLLPSPLGVGAAHGAIACTSAYR